MNLSLRESTQYYHVLPSSVWGLLVGQRTMVPHGPPSGSSAMGARGRARRAHAAEAEKKEGSIDMYLRGRYATNQSSGWW